MNPSLSIFALATANLTPLAGVLLVGWDAAIIILLYWTENLVIGLYNTLKIALVRVSNPPVGHLGKLFAIPFFWLHFGGFCGMHGLFLLAIFKIGTGSESLFPNELWPGHLAFIHLLVNSISILCLFASHGISFVQNYLGQKEYLELTIGKLMNQPYSRIFIMQITVILGGWLIMLLHSPTVLVCLFVLFKISMDIFMHTREHKASEEKQVTEKHE